MTTQDEHREPVAENPVVEVAKETRQKKDEPVTLLTGVRVKFKPVAASLVASVTAKYEYPKVPMWFNPDKGREEENPTHPDYLAERERTDAQRAIASMDAMAMFGVELIDGLPEDKRWIKQLKLLGIEFDETDDVACEFYYKRYIALSSGDYLALGQLTGLTEQAISEAARQFRRKAQRRTD
jgi:hypothetical protein